MEKIEMFKTTDGETFEDENDAKAHQHDLDCEYKLAEYRSALMAAGYSKDQAQVFARGHAMFTRWELFGEIPPATKRARKQVDLPGV